MAESLPQIHFEDIPIDQARAMGRGQNLRGQHRLDPANVAGVNRPRRQIFKVEWVVGVGKPGA